MPLVQAVPVGVPASVKPVAVVMEAGNATVMGKAPVLVTTWLRVLDEPTWTVP